MSVKRKELLDLLETVRESHEFCDYSNKCPECGNYQPCDDKYKCEGCKLEERITEICLEESLV